MLCLDVYRNDFAQSYYDSLVALAQGKPLALAEVGNPPSPGILAAQPLWTYYATWAGMVRNTSKQDYAALFADPRILSLGDDAYAEAVAPFRAACGLPPVDVENPPPDFSGTWVLNEAQSTFGPMGAGFIPVKLAVTHAAGSLAIQSTRILEYAADEVSEQTLALDGTPSKSRFLDYPRTTIARAGADGATISMESITEVPFGPPGNTIRSRDTWTLRHLGDQLVIHNVAPSFSGPGEVEQTWIYDRR